MLNEDVNEKNDVYTPGMMLASPSAYGDKKKHANIQLLNKAIKNYDMPVSIKQENRSNKNELARLKELFARVSQQQNSNANRNIEVEMAAKT